MAMLIANLVTRSIIVILGIAILVGITPFDTIDSPLREIFGAIAVLFGAVRLWMLYINFRQTRRER